MPVCPFFFLKRILVFPIHGLGGPITSPCYGSSAGAQGVRYRGALITGTCETHSLSVSPQLRVFRLAQFRAQGFRVDWRPHHATPPS